MKDDISEVANVAQRLKQARELAGLSQSQAAKFMDLHRPTISEIEANRRKVSANELAQFAEIYRVEPNWLLGRNEENLENSEIALAAREIAKLNEEDREKLFALLKVFRK